jgi:hypothetical protein
MGFKSNGLSSRRYLPEKIFCNYLFISYVLNIIRIDLLLEVQLQIQVSRGELCSLNLVRRHCERQREDNTTSVAEAAISCTAFGAHRPTSGYRTRRGLLQVLAVIATSFAHFWTSVSGCRYKANSSNLPNSGQQRLRADLSPTNICKEDSVNHCQGLKGYCIISQDVIKITKGY